MYDSCFSLSLSLSLTHTHTHSLFHLFGTNLSVWYNTIKNLHEQVFVVYGLYGIEQFMVAGRAGRYFT